MKSEDKQSFIIRHGILQWAIPIAIIYSFIMSFTEKDLYKVAFISDYFLDNLLISCFAFSIGGYLFGYFMWRRYIKNFKSKEGKIKK
ncbi:peptidylprolyl isomerase [Clostridium novyi B str. ATCC 27606]|uniref:Peptidylprolyl isomerase n=2 Tax=Clostridium TaxID=1485 RepID=A0AA40M4T9_CLONO|nr:MULTISPECIES: hypothetical protein [Clostridium]KEI11187.1 peptidylprolyl isomerase [Clostridium novyi B str. NCTC 9691]KEI12913.1 peptidylprolyl isomerase [Clostridium novyi B str. ATCC 27606]KEI16348.1 peptidylprolyl isomerase [Clostridium haemolyticum NCTC 9693]KGN04673.1 peptidylprolyl isomerase [Clostridium haemolyticum NCTC 8350]OOB76695.1 peptidylprolyl isomerase [Clostridium haemolyticum]